MVAWLERHGLGRYARRFADNQVDMDVLPFLTGDDLREMGIAAVGHRRRLLRAIETLRAEAAASGTVQAVPGAERPPAAAAERRWLTVLFADLADSTALAHRLDPEELHDVIRAYHALAVDRIEHFGGSVAKFMGDGVLAYFGWPRAHEDAAERAVHAGLALVEAVGRLAVPGGDKLAVRVGVATGLVVIGDRASGPAAEDGVVGETPNLAARLQALAAPDTLVIGAETRRLVGALFALRALGHRRLKGFPAAVPVFQVLGQGHTADRFEALHGETVTALVGRERELALLLDRWEQAEEGEGQIVLLSGEAGIGKSRLLRALRQPLAQRAHKVLDHFCSPLHQTRALHPFVDRLERACDFLPADPPPVKLGKLEAMLRDGAVDPAAALPAMVALLEIPPDERLSPLELPADALKERIFATLLDFIAGAVREATLLLIFEDVHWADPTTLELIDRLIDRAQQLPVMIVATYRPDGAPRWAWRSHMTSLALNRLSRRRGAALVAALTSGRTLPATVREQIIDKADGVPLFLEELTRTVLESSPAPAATDPGGPSDAAAIAIPANLYDSLLVRLDRSRPVKELAQTAAVIGREFSRELLGAVAGLPASELDHTLERLVETTLVSRQGGPANEVYVFKHALVRDVAYQSLLKSRRRQLHGRIVEVLEERLAGTLQPQPEVLAYHSSEAGLAEKAAGYWLKAGQRALTRSAIAEAVTQLEKGLALVEPLPESPARRRLELDIQVAVGPALIAARGFAAPETGHAYERACELAFALDDSAALFPALYGRAVYHFQRGEIATTLALSRQLLERAEALGWQPASIVGHRMVGSALSQLGRLAESRHHLETALAGYDPGRDAEGRFAYAIDSRVMCLAWLAHVLALQGHIDESRSAAAAAAEWASELAHASTTAVLHCWGCIHAQLLHDGPQAVAHAEAAMRLGREQGFPLWSAVGRLIRGWAMAAAGDANEGRAEIAGGLADYHATGARMWSPYFIGLLAEATWRDGDIPGGLALVGQATASLAATGARWIEAELRRLEGELMLARRPSDAATAEALLAAALATADAQDARLWQFRAAIALAKLWQRRGLRAAALALLRQRCAEPVEGADCRDRRSATALLRRLEKAG